MDYNELFEEDFLNYLFFKHESSAFVIEEKEQHKSFQTKIITLDKSKFEEIKAFLSLHDIPVFIHITQSGDTILMHLKVPVTLTVAWIDENKIQSETH